MSEDPGSTSLNVQVVVRDAAWSRSWPDRRAALECAARLAYARATGDRQPAGAVDLAIVLADDGLLRELNRTYRGQDAATNVLSFEGSDPAGSDPTDSNPGEAWQLGDVVLARETIAREAGAQAKRFADHAVHLTVHGVLHLLGHDHETDAETRQMEALEIAILDALGIADPYGEVSEMPTAASEAR
jgi:probable rRNA maturation factor